MSELDGSSIAGIIAGDVMSFEPMATNFAKSRFMVLATEYSGNEKEAAEVERLANAVLCSISQSGSGFSLNTEFQENSNYFEIMTNGMPAPLAGGSGGIAHNPDGSTYHSNVPPHLWGTVLEELAKTGTDIVGEIKMMLTDLFRNRVQEAVNNNKPSIAQLAKQVLMGNMSFAT